MGVPIPITPTSACRTAEADSGLVNSRDEFAPAAAGDWIRRDRSDRPLSTESRGPNESVVVGDLLVGLVNDPTYRVEVSGEALHFVNVESLEPIFDGFGEALEVACGGSGSVVPLGLRHLAQSNQPAED